MNPAVDPQPLGPSIAVLDDYQHAALRFGPWSTLPEGCTVVPFADHVDDADALVARLAPFDVVCVMRERTAFPRSVLERLPQLRLLVTTGGRNAAIDVAACTDLGITVCGTGGAQHGTAELTWALILGLLRHVPEEVASIRAGGWQHTVGGDLEGSTLGVVGLGRLGARVARIGLAFGMDVVAWSQNLTEERCAEVGVRAVAKAELFATADVVTLHVVLSERSRGLVAAEDLARMKPTALLVNTSRGPIVDEAALVDVLRRQAIAGAALDVFDPEPLAADHPFRELRNVLPTPHIGYVTRQGYDVFFTDVVDDVRAWLAGAPVRVITG